MVAVLEKNSMKSTFDELGQLERLTYSGGKQRERNRLRREA